MKIPDTMNALAQYIDLYRNHRELIDANSCGPLNNLREEAAKRLEYMKLPKKGEENYENISLQDILTPDYGVNIARVNIDVNPAFSFRCNVPNISPALFFLVNDSFAAADNSSEGLPEGLTVTSLRTAGLNNPDLIERYYGKAAAQDNPIVLLDTLLAQDGIFIHVEKNVKVEKPLQIVNILQNGMPLMAARRVLIVLEEGASLSLLSCDHTQNPDTDFLSLSTTEIFCAPDSNINFYDMEESSERTNRLSALYIVQQERSHAVIDGMTLLNGQTRNEYYCRLDGREAELKLLGMGIEDSSRVLSTYSRIDHNATHCRSNELFKYSVDNNASGEFAGLIYVAPGAIKTEAYQSNRNLVGNDTARMFSKPQLEIYNDDVKCSHGSATGQLDELQIFYMRTRGLDLPTANLLLKQAFMSEVVDAVEIPALRERLHMLVERRFAGESFGCNSCANACR